MQGKHFYAKSSTANNCSTRETPHEHWNVIRHTELLPTDAYGTIEFQGGPHPTKAQVIAFPSKLRCINYPMPLARGIEMLNQGFESVDKHINMEIDECPRVIFTFSAFSNDERYFNHLK